MNILQAEGWHLWKKSMGMPRQARRRAVVSVPWRDRLASILVVLLTGTWLLGTPAFGDNREEMMAYWSREAAEAQASMSRCLLEYSPSSGTRRDVEEHIAKVNKCLEDRQPRYAEAVRCTNPLAKRCGYGKTFEEVWLEGMEAIEQIVKNSAKTVLEDADDITLWLDLVAAPICAAMIIPSPATPYFSAFCASAAAVRVAWSYHVHLLKKVVDDPPRDDIDIVSRFKSPTFALPVPVDDLEARWQAFNVKVVSTAVCLNDLVTSQERVDGALMVMDRHGAQSVPQLPVQMAAVQHNATACAKLLRELSLLKQPTNEAWHTLMDILRRHQIDPTTLSPQEISAHLRTLWEQQKPQLHTQWGLSQADIAELTQAMETGIERMADRIPKLPDVLLDDKWVKSLEFLAQALEQLALAYATGIPSGQPEQHSPPVPQR